MRGKGAAVVLSFLWGASFLSIAEAKAAPVPEAAIAGDPVRSCASAERPRPRLPRLEEDMAGLLGLAAILWLKRDAGAHDGPNETETLLNGLREMKRRAGKRPEAGTPAQRTDCPSLGRGSDLLQAHGMGEP